MESIVSSKIKNKKILLQYRCELLRSYQHGRLHPSSSLCLLLCRFPFLSSGILSSSAVAGTVAIATESLQRSEGKSEKKRKEKKRKEKKRKEKKRVMLTRKGGGKGKFWAKNCTSCLPLKFSFSSVLFSTQRLVSLNFSWSFHLFLLSIPPALSLILHLSLHVLKLRANYSFWLYDTRSYVLLYVCVCVCSVCSPTPPLL